MKSFVAAIVLALTTSSYAFASCDGEAYITASVLRVEKTGLSSCKAFIDPITVVALIQNPLCPLSLELLKEKGFNAGVINGHDCAMEQGDRLNGHFSQQYGVGIQYQASANINLAGKFVSSAALSAFNVEFNKQCKSMLYTVKQLNLVSAKAEHHRIDQGYLDLVWTLTFEIEYKNFVQQKTDTVSVQITEGLEDRDGTLETYVDTFATHYGSDNDAICNQ